MSLNDEFVKILTDTDLFLKQQRELYGDAIFISKNNLSDVKLPETISLNNMNLPLPDADLPGSAAALQVSQQKNEMPAYPNEAWVKTQTLNELNKSINTCTKCSLSKTRKKFVFGVGNPNAEVVVVGEAPGADEDEQGEPFVGRAGQLLNKILEAIQFKREDVYICNILKCRPPNNRDPQSEEIDGCEPYLWKQLEIIKPKAILCVGRIAGQSILKTDSSLTQLRERVHDYRGIPLMVTYHPAALLRNPNWKKPCWEDVQNFKKLCDKMKNNKS